MARKLKAAKHYKKMTDELAEASSEQLAAMLEGLYNGNYDVVKSMVLSDFEAGHLAAQLAAHLKIKHGSHPKVPTPQQTPHVSG